MCGGLVLCVTHNDVMASLSHPHHVSEQIWLTDKKSHVSNLKDAEAKLDKDIFRNGSPKKGSPPKKARKKVVQEDPGPARPTTAKRREGRPSSAERNRNEAVQPSVWLEHMSRDSKAGTRSFIECTPGSANGKVQRPSSADRKRDKKDKKKKKRVGVAATPDRPSSAERNRDEKINNAVWLDGQAVRSDERPSSAGRQRAAREAETNNNGQVLDQNGKPMGLAPLKGVTPLKPILRPGKAAEI